MALDFSILTSQPSVVDRFLAGQQEAQRNALAQQQLLHAQQQNALAKAQMEETQRARAEQNALRTAIPADFDPMNPAHQAAAYRAAPTLAPAFIEKAILTRKTAGEIKEKDVKTQAEQFKLQQDKLEHGLRSLTSAATPEAARAAIEEGVALGHFDRATADRQLATLSMDPQGYSKWRVEKVLGLMDAKDRFAATQPKPIEVGTGKTKKFIDQNPNSPTFGREVMPEIKMTATPGEELTARTTMRGQDITAATAAAGQEVTKRGQDIQRELAFKPTFNAQAGGYVVPPSAAAPRGGFIPLPQIAATKDQEAAQKALKTAGYDPETGVDRIEELIKKSTSGMLQTAAAGTIAHVLGTSTSGRQAISALASRANQMALDLAGGKLGAGISNEDRKFIVSTLGDVADPVKPVEERLAAWREAKTRMLTSGMIQPPKAPSTVSSGTVQPAAPSANIDALLDKYK